MRSFSRLTVFLALIFIFKSTWASPQSGHDSSGSRSRRGAPCGTDMSSLNNICCLNCPAGTHMKSPCTKHGEMGECGECDYGTFTEHSNDLKQCFKCAQCRPDQIIVRPCIQTQNTECECKAGRFCAHDQACEVCKKCSRCEKDEVIVRNCTSTTNTECKKIQSPPPSGNTWLWPSLSASLIVVAIAVVVAVLYKKHKASDSQSSRPDGLKPGEESFPKLVPVNDGSLQKCFEYFEEVDICYHNRFFRYIGISDNVIKSKEYLPYADRIHELLNIWMEQKGREASLNDLLKALLDLSQRRTAEHIRQCAIQHGHYTECENELSEQFSGNI
ncbi:hematopoietic death receptor isoform X2 [Scomber scombrus]|uniref:hematopoietic death receptor isoform X2 n=1 Tax=Scomber scombrus TaxID=13677 RepID=UPI002DD7B375|nr:hematopoietic death receptor isoform X2 [Scomber scombrus]